MRELTVIDFAKFGIKEVQGDLGQGFELEDDALDLFTETADQQ